MAKQWGISLGSVVGTPELDHAPCLTYRPLLVVNSSPAMDWECEDMTSPLTSAP